MKRLQRPDTESKSAAKDFKDRMCSANFFSIDDFPKAIISFAGTRFGLIPFQQSRFGLSVWLTIKSNAETMNLPTTVTINKCSTLTLKAKVPLNRTRQDVQQASVFSFISQRNDIAANA